MAVPTFVSSGSITTAAAAVAQSFGGSLAIGDICLQGVQTLGTDPAPTLSGGDQTWTQVTTQVQGNTRATVFWCRLTTATPTASTIDDSGDHQSGRIIAIRGCHATGNPWDNFNTSVDTTSDTSGVVTGFTTSVNECFVCMWATGNLPDASGTAEYTWDSFGNLTSGTERTDNSVASGAGGSMSWATGALATAGAIGDPAYTKANAAVKAHITIALKPPQVAGSLIWQPAPSSIYLR